MYCTKCGFENSTGSAFCVNCGIQLEANPGFAQQNDPQLQYSGQQDYYSSQSSTPYEQINNLQNSLPKKSRKGLTIGIISGFIVLAAAAVLLLFVFTGNSITGTWYCEERGTVIQFSDNNRAEIHSLSGTEYAGFNYQSDKKEGTIKADEGELDFTLEDGVLTLDNAGDAEFKKASNIDTDKVVMSAVYGVWASEQMGEVIELTADGTAIKHNIEGVTEGTFRYKTEKGEGLLTFGDEEIAFTATYESLNIKDGAVYKKAETTLNIDEFVQEFSNNILGLWYDKAGLAGTIEFKKDGVVTLSIMGISLDGTYTFDTEKGVGTLTLSFAGEEQSVDFTCSDGELNIDGSIYTKEVVEQKDLADVLNETGN